MSQNGEMEENRQGSYLNQIEERRGQQEDQEDGKVGSS